MTNTQKIKQYIALVHPSKPLFWGNLLIWILYYLMGLFSAIPSANAISSISKGDLPSTINWLIASFLVVCVQQFLLFLSERCFYAQVKDVWQKVQTKVFDKISNASKVSLKQVGKEKIMNITYANMGALTDFPRDSAKCISYFLQAAVSIIILLIYNLLIGTVIVILCVLNFLIQNIVHKKIANYVEKYYYWQDKSFENMSDNYSNHRLSFDLGISNSLKTKYLQNVQKSMDFKYKFGMLYTITDVWLPFFSKLILCALSVYMVYLTKSSLLTLTLYLILTNYTSQALSQISNSYSILTQINDAYVASLRVKNLLDMKDQDFINFGNNSTDQISGQIIFTNTSFYSNSKDIASIDNFNLTIKKRSSVLFFGSAGCGKRAIFLLLNRTIRPKSGTITIDNINIFDFDNQTYKHNVSAVLRRPYFFCGSIMDNLQASGANKTQIYQTCKQLGIHQKIVQTQHSYSTNLQQEPNAFTNFDKYVLSIARAVCTSAEILIFYEFPEGITPHQRDKLTNILKGLMQSHTVIIFSHDNWPKKICGQVYHVELGKIKKQNKK